MLEKKSKLALFIKNCENVFVNTFGVILYSYNDILGVGLIYWVFSSLFIH